MKLNIALMIIVSMILVMAPLVSASFPQNLKTGLVNYYSFDNVLDGNFTDIIKGNNITASTGTQIVSGILRNALNITYGSNATSINNLTVDFLGTTNKSVGFWSRLNGNVSTRTETMLFFGKGAVGDAWMTGQTVGKLFFDDYSGSWTTTTAINDSWHYHVLVWNTTTMLWYLDGVLNGTSAGLSINPTDSKLIIGARIDNALQARETIDELGLWNRTLNSSEINQLWNNGQGLGYYGITLNSPNDYQSILGRNVTFNITSTTAAGMNLINITLYINNILNETKTLSGSLSNTVFSKTMNYGNYNWSVNVCDDSGYACLDSNLRYFNTTTFIINNATNYNSTSYETATESYSLNITTDGTSIPTANLYYNGTSYAGTISGTSPNYIFTKTLTIPTSTGTKNVFWNINYEGTNINTTTTQQTVNPLYFVLCNSTVVNPYINFTFLDENTLTNINGTFNPLTTTYYLGDGSVTKSLIFTNITENYNYAFCLNINRTLHTSMDAVYAGLAGAVVYPARSWYSTLTLTNSTTSQPLYLLSSDDGISAFIQVVDQNTNKVSGATITVVRTIGGNPITIAQVITGDDGGSSFWLSPNYPYTFTISKSGCTSASVTFTPAQPQYTLTMQCGTNLLTDNYITGLINGMYWARSPMTGILSRAAGTSVIFDYQINSKSVPMTAVKFELVNQTLKGNNRTVVNSSIATVPTVNCTSSSCYLSFTYTPHAGEELWGHYYVNVGSGWVLLEGDGHWRFILNQPSSVKTMKNLFNDFTGIFSSWSTVNDQWSLNGTSGHCINNYVNGTIMPYYNYDDCTTIHHYIWFPDEKNKEEYSRIVFFFLAMAIVFALFNKFTGYDTAYPGFYITGIAVMVLILSIYNGTAGQGYFYYNNLIPEVYPGFAWINNYILALTLIFITGGMWLGILSTRRA